MTVTLLVLEVTARLLFRWPAFAHRMQSLGPTGLLISQLADYADEEPSLRMVGQVWHPTLGWTNRVGRSNAGGTFTANVTSQGLRGSKEIAARPIAGITRVEVFGDSFVFGTDAADAETYAAQLESLVPGSEVLNFGVPGYGLDQCLLRFREEGRQYQPDVVVLGLMGLLFFRSHTGFEAWHKPYFELSGDELRLRGSPVPSPDEVYRRFLWSPRTVDVFLLLREGLTRSAPSPVAHESAFDRRLLEQFVSEVRATGAQPVLVLHPALHGNEVASQRVFHETCTQPGVQCLDLIPTFERARASGQNLASGAHWNAAGHRLVAQALAELLRPRTLGSAEE